MQRKETHSAKIWWSLALFINVLLMILAIFTKNIPGCLAVIVFGIYLSKYGDPVIFADYNRKREEKYQQAQKKRQEYLRKKEEDAS
ncbi:hypothetical protein LFYK43_21460 [Ligilactobacillus salitolerans]|uniref:Uncharacterized protein n=1 Tax=Ligilactobacillus salitolerans TaxID=1808352 RepID=A0A401IW17_9LACO|nr:hypothetical protein [Ligilactobacillus salitolerans]GBG95687.1 hypothetical protein LFYK43_21460 [Ligilactobacillus salitolerans]